MNRILVALLCVTGLCMGQHSTAAAQEPEAEDTTVSPARAWIRPLTQLGGEADERLRLQNLLGRGRAGGSLLRSASTLSRAASDPSPELRWAWLGAEAEMIWNSEIPFSLNGASVWAGRGRSSRMMTGAWLSFGPASLILAPQVVHIENQPFFILPSTAPRRSTYASPWHAGPLSADLPLRFGNRSLTILDPGQSTLALRLGGWEVGGSTENQWWGPGIRNAILLSNNAPGFPHLFLRTGAPVATRVGEIETRWLVGGLTESLYFDNDPANDVRALSAGAITLRPALEPGLTLGLARAVYAPVSGAGAVPGRFLDPLLRWDRPYRDSTAVPGEAAEQILSLFGRWVFPEDGFEVHFEWARVEPPGSLRSLLLAPQETQGYTMGLQWARPIGDDGAFRLQAELTYLEQTKTDPKRVEPSFYLSRTVPQGYTHRGKVLGAAIGPGASSQWLALDYLGKRWRAGAFAGRIRWENDAYYLLPRNRFNLGHDVSVLGGLRAGGQTRFGGVEVEYTGGLRYNYLFQNPGFDIHGTGAVDVTNHTLRLVVRPPS